MSKPRTEPEPVVNGWALREVLFEDGEPIAHREPPTRCPLTEPGSVARVDDLERGGRVRALAMGLSLDAPLYTAPPTRSPLTDEEITEIAASNLGDYGDGEWHLLFARAIERKSSARNNS